jgi:hypothetical protein
MCATFFVLHLNIALQVTCVYVVTFETTLIKQEKKTLFILKRLLTALKVLVVILGLIISTMMLKNS